MKQRTRWFLCAAGLLLGCGGPLASAHLESVERRAG